MNDTQRLNELGQHAAKAVAAAAGKYTLIQRRKKGPKRRVANLDIALIVVDPVDVLWLCDRAQPASEEAQNVVDALRQGSANANQSARDAGEVAILAKDFAVLCAAAGFGAEPSSEQPAPAAPETEE